ncbi:MAG: hypothetical protein QY312_02700 [Candidatus Dojkabacteria bacterium]|nr:MAG: hypothetical protein QY312_02700 [Candidatus Dojkabacteria bacterium]
MKLSFSTFKTELSYYDGKTNVEKWLSFLEELSIYADYNWDIPQMQYDLVKSDEEWQKFLSHPERQPFKISVTEWQDFSLEQAYSRSLQAIQFSLSLWKSTTLPKEKKEQIKSLCGSIIKGTLHSRYQKYAMERTDLYFGITPYMRATGNLQVTSVHEAQFNYFTAIAAQELHQPVEEIRTKLLNAAQGNLARLKEYFATCQYDDELKTIITAYRQAAAGDHALTDNNIRLAFRIWQDLYAYGIDLDAYLLLMGYPKNTKQRLLQAAKNKEIHAEIHAHMKRERPRSFATMKRKGQVSLLDLYQEEAQLYDYPRALRSEQETEKMIARCKTIVSRYFPLSIQETPRQLVFQVTHPFGATRAYQSKTQNSNKQGITITVMTPLIDSEQDYLRTLAHETTHAIHTLILQRGKEFGVLTEQQENSIPSSVMEDFSQLVEGQFSTETPKRISQKSGKYFANFSQALGSYWQIPYSLLQLCAREYFETLIRQGVSSLTSDHIAELRIMLNKISTESFEKTVRLHRDAFDALTWVSSLSPYDGLVYAKRFIVPPKTTKSIKSEKSTNTGMNTNFEKRFGKKWIDNPEARIILYWLLLESGRNHATETFGEYIDTIEVTSCLQELEKIGISTEEFYGNAT